MATEHAPKGGHPELRLDSDSRRQLGLEDNELVQILSAEGPTILLKRIGPASDQPAPRDGELALMASVDSFPPADVLGLVHDARKSGLLAFGCGEIEKEIYLHRGEVIFATSNRIVDRLGECLLRAHVITLEQLKEAQRGWAPDVPLGKVLVERGFLTPRELWNGVKHQVEEIVRSLFAYTAGRIHFWEGTVQPDNIVRLSLPTRRLVVEGLERQEELLKFRSRLEDPQLRVLAVPDAGGEERAGNERAIFEALASESRFPALCERIGIDLLSGARTIQLLQQVGAVRLEHGDGAAGRSEASDSGNVEDEALRGCVLAHVELLNALVAPLVSADGAGAVEERLAHAVDETASRFPEYLSTLPVGEGAVVDPDELTQRALRLSGDRLRTVSAALGELVAYLEFELKNHPRIDEPGRVLDALGSLRAKIDL